MINTPREKVKRLEDALKSVQVSTVRDTPTPAGKWRQDVMRSVRLEQDRMAMVKPSTTFSGLLFPMAQIGCSLLLLVGLFLATDSSLATIDLTLVDVNLVSASESLVMNFDF